MRKVVGITMGNAKSGDGRGKVRMVERRWEEKKGIPLRGDRVREERREKWREVREKNR